MIDNGNFWGTSLGFLLIPLVAWATFWKGWALWRAARAGSKVWFVVLLISNTVGVLDILYIFVFGRSSAKASAVKRKK